MTDSEDRNNALRRSFDVAEPWLALRGAHSSAGVVVEVSTEPRLCVIGEASDDFEWRAALDDDDAPLLDAAAPVVRLLLADRDADEVTDIAAGKHGALRLALHPASGTALLLAGAVIVGAALMQAIGEPVH